MKFHKQIFNNLYDSAKKENTINFSQKSFELNKYNNQIDKNDKLHLKNTSLTIKSKVKNKQRINLRKNNSQSALTSSIQDLKFFQDDNERINKNLFISKSNLIKTLHLDSPSSEHRNLFNSNLLKNKKIKIQTVSNLESTLKSINSKRTLYTTLYNPADNVKSISHKNSSDFEPNSRIRKNRSKDFREGFSNKYGNENIKHNKELNRLIELISTSKRKKEMDKVFSSTVVNFTNDLKKDDLNRTVFRTPNHEMRKNKIEDMTLNFSPEKDKDTTNILDINHLEEKKKNNLKKRRFASFVVKDMNGGKESENPLLLIKKYQNKIDEKLLNKKDDFFFATPDKLKNHIIRDHKIGMSNIIANSKKKFESTVALYESIEMRKRNEIEREIEKFYESNQKKSRFIEPEEIENITVVKKNTNIDSEYYEVKKDDVKKKLVFKDNS
jgi:hypothetical protein